MIKRLLRNKKVIFILGDRKEEVKTFARFILNDSFSLFVKNGLPECKDIFSFLRSEVIIIVDNEKNDPEKINIFLSDLNRGVVIITETEKKARVRKIVKRSLENLVLIIDFSISKKLRKKKKVFTFGINKKNADFSISDIVHKEEKINFKINYSGNTIPFWVNKNLKSGEIKSLLPAICLAKIFKLNLADISYRIREKLNV